MHNLALHRMLLAAKYSQGEPMIDNQRRIELLEETLWSILVQQGFKEASLQHDVIREEEECINGQYEIATKKFGIKHSREEFVEVIWPIIKRLLDTLRLNDDLLPQYRYRRVITEDYLPGKREPVVSKSGTLPVGATQDQVKRLMEGKHPDFPDE